MVTCTQDPRVKLVLTVLRNAILEQESASTGHVSASIRTLDPVATKQCVIHHARMVGIATMDFAPVHMDSQDQFVKLPLVRSVAVTTVGMMESATEMISVCAQALTLEDTVKTKYVRLNA